MPFVKVIAAVRIHIYIWHYICVYIRSIRRLFEITSAEQFAYGEKLVEPFFVLRCTL